MEDLQEALQLANEHERMLGTVCRQIAICYVEEAPLETIDAEIGWCSYNTLYSRLYRYILNTYPETYIDPRKLMCYMDYAYDIA